MVYTIMVMYGLVAEGPLLEHEEIDQPLRVGHTAW